MVAPWKILPCLSPAFVKIKDRLMPLPDLRSKSGSIAKNGLGSSRPKLWNRDWLASWKCIFVFDENFSQLSACELAIFTQYWLVILTLFDARCAALCAVAACHRFSIVYLACAISGFDEHVYSSFRGLIYTWRNRLAQSSRLVGSRFQLSLVSHLIRIILKVFPPPRVWQPFTKIHLCSLFSMLRGLLAALPLSLIVGPPCIRCIKQL